jgi:hypothetical protein
MDRDAPPAAGHRPAIVGAPAYFANQLYSTPVTSSTSEFPRQWAFSTPGVHLSTT